MTKIHAHTAKEIRRSLKGGVCRICLGQGFFGRLPHEVACSACGGTGRAPRPSRVTPTYKAEGTVY